MSSILFKNSRSQRYIINSRFGMPPSIQIEITTKCNISCPLCLRTIDPAKVVDADMSLDLFKSIIRQIKGKTRDVSLVGLGEPLLHPEIFSMIRFAKENDLEVSIIDNFTLINREKSIKLIESGLDYLYVSFDNITKEEFEKRRTGAIFEEVVKNIKLFIETKKELNAKTPSFIFKSTISNSNFPEVFKLIKFAEDIGADGINFGKMMDQDESRIINPPTLNESNLPKSKITVYPCELGDYYICDATRGLYVTYDGKVLPCGLMAESVSRANYPKIELGDLNSETISTIWRSERFRQLRKNLDAGKYLPECKTCGGYNKHPKKH